MSQLSMTRPRWRLLGPLDGSLGSKELDPGPPLRRAVLALLVAHGGAPVSVHTITDALWGEDPPDQAVNIVQKHVGSLRRLVQPGLARRATGSWLLPAGPGYRIDINQADLDVVRFRTLVRSSRQHRDPQPQLVMLRQALDLWRGQVGDGLPVSLTQTPPFVALNREHATVAIRAAELAVELDQSTDLLPALRSAASFHPLDELLQAQLLRVLSGAGLRGEAVDLYAVLRRRLVAELGLEPGAALRAAHEDLLAGQRPVPQATGALPTPSEVPADQPAFVARGAEIEHLSMLSERSAQAGGVVVITGVPGVGKTSLAIHHAHRVAALFPDGRFYIDLRGFDPSSAKREPGDVLARLLEGLAVSRDKIPHDDDARSALFRSVIASKRVLILLDNARDAEQVRPLLPGSPGSMVVITSRAQLLGLRADGAHGVALSQLDESETRQFLTARLGQPRLDRQEAAVTLLAKLSGGLPLALAIAASRAAQVPEAPISVVATQLRSMNRRLDSFSDAADARIDIRSVFSWSLDALSAEAAELFALLALHPGPSIGVAAAASLGGWDEPVTWTRLTELAGAGLITEGLPGRYHRHDLLRAYSADLLERVAANHREAARVRLYDYAGTSAVLAARAYSPDRILRTDPDVVEGSLPSRADGHAWFDAEQELLINLVVEAPDIPSYDIYLWRIGWSLIRVLDERARWDANLLVQSRAVAAAARSGTWFTQVAMRTGHARALGRFGRLAEAIDEIDAAMSAVSGRPPDPDEVVEDLQMARGELHRLKSWTLEIGGFGLPSALSEAELAVAQYPADDQSIYRAHALAAVGWCETLMGRHDAALQHARSALTLIDRAGEYPQGRADTLETLGHAHYGRGELELSIRCYSDCLRIWQELGYLSSTASISVALAEVSEAAGDREGARTLLEQALEIYDELEHDDAGGVRDRLAALG